MTIRASAVAGQPTLTFRVNGKQPEAGGDKSRETVPKRFQNVRKRVGFEIEGTYAFGSFRLDASAEILFRGAAPFGRRAIAVLRTLVERATEPVSTDALIEAATAALAAG